MDLLWCRYNIPSIAKEILTHPTGPTPPLMIMKTLVSIVTQKPSTSVKIRAPLASICHEPMLSGLVVDFWNAM